MSSMRTFSTLRSRAVVSQLQPRTFHTSIKFRQQNLGEEPEARISPAIYRPFLRPFAKVFFGAMLTYQILYWCWEKMRLSELKEGKLAELRDLEAQVDAYKQSKAAAASKDPLGAEKVSTGLLGTIQGLFR